MADDQNVFDGPASPGAESVPPAGAQQPDARPGNLATAWKPGQSGNPKGRPKGAVNITNVLRRKLAEPCANDKDKRPWADVLVDFLLTSFMAGNSTAIREVLERIDGKVPNNVRLSTDPDNPLGIAVVDARSRILGELSRIAARKGAPPDTKPN